jgi:hypothetical protein
VVDGEERDIGSGEDQRQPDDQPENRTDPIPRAADACGLTGEPRGIGIVTVPEVRAVVSSRVMPHTRERVKRG